MTTKLEKQELIDQKDWTNLAQTDIFRNFAVDNISSIDYTLSKEFFLEFYFNTKYFPESSIYYANIVKNGLIKLNKFSISKKEYTNIIRMLADVATQRNIKSILAGVYYYTFKPGVPQYFYEAILENKTIIDFFVGGGGNSLDLTNVKNFPKELVKEIISKLNVGFFDHRELLSTIIPDYKELIELVYSIRSLRGDLGEIFKNLSEEDFLDLVKYIKSKGVDDPYLYKYYVENNLKLPKDFFNEVKESGASTLISDLIPAMTDAQLQDVAGKISSYKLAVSGISLEFIEKLKGKKLNDLSGTRFFTEEEIIEYPHFFDPEVLKATPLYYISKETFKLLNKTWGKKQRYNDELTDFYILAAGSGFYKDATNRLKYLQKKTGASNSNVVKVIANMMPPKDSELDIIKKLLNKYK